MPTPSQQFARPTGMCSNLHRDQHGGFAVKAFQKGLRRGHHPLLRYDRSLFAHNADAASFVPQINSYISAGRPRRHLDILAHELVSLPAPLGSAFSTTGSSLLHAAEGDQSSHSIFSGGSFLGCKDTTLSM